PLLRAPSERWQALGGATGDEFAACAAPTGAFGSGMVFVGAPQGAKAAAGYRTRSDPRPARSRSAAEQARHRHRIRREPEMDVGGSDRAAAVDRLALAAVRAARPQPWVERRLRPRVMEGV